MIANIKGNLDDHLKVIGLINNENYISKIYQITTSIIECYKKGGKLIFVGNGGSFSDCLHLSAEFTGRFNIDRKPLNSIVLGSNPSSLTAISNDYGYENWVSKAIEYYVNSNDRVIFISVSGESKNLVNGLNYAIKNNIKTASLTGSNINNTLKENTECSLWVDSKAYNIVESIHTIWITLIIDLFVGTPEYSVNE